MESDLRPTLGATSQGPFPTFQAAIMGAPWGCSPRRDCGLPGTVSERQPSSSHLLHGSLPTKEMVWNSFFHLPAARNCIIESTLWAWAWNEELTSVSGGLGLPDYALSSRCADPTVAVWTKGTWERRPNGTNKREQRRNVTTWNSHWGQNLALPLGGLGPPRLDRAIMTNRANACEGLSTVSGITDKHSHYWYFYWITQGTLGIAIYHHGNELAWQQLQISATDKQKRLKD